MKNQKRKKPRISQCMIVKNEEKNIERALSWGKDIMWEQIVVDTGSTDRTVELALLPVWFLSYRNGDRVSYAVVNGQTGKAAADLPVDGKRYLAGSLLLAVPLFFLLNSYTTGLSPAVMEYLLGAALRRKGALSSSEIGLPVKESGMVLPCGSTAVWEPAR